LITLDRGGFWQAWINFRRPFKLVWDRRETSGEFAGLRWWAVGPIRVMTHP
jgi:hypothetical protein